MRRGILFVVAQVGCATTGLGGLELSESLTVAGNVHIDGNLTVDGDSPGGSGSEVCADDGSDYTCTGVVTATGATVNDGTQELMQVGQEVVANLEASPKNVNTGVRFSPVPLDGNDESAAFYCRANPDGEGVDHSTCFYMEVTSEQADTEAGAMKIIHEGGGDAIYIAAFAAGPALETASFYNGSRGFISTNQWIPGDPVTYDFSGSVLYNSVWGFDGTGGSKTAPLYGAFYNSLSLGQSFAIRLHQTTADGFAWGTPEYSIREYALDRYRFRVYNSGQTTLESTAATAGAPLQAAPMLELRGSYWNGAAAVDKDFQWQSSMDGSGNPILLLQAGTNASEVTVATYYHDGDVIFTGGVEPANKTGDPCAGMTEGSMFYNDTSDYMCFCDGGGNDKQVHSPGTACF